MEQRPPLPPFMVGSAKQKVQLAEDAWNSKDPLWVSMAYTLDTFWRNRSQFIYGREKVQEFLKGKWEKELDYILKKRIMELYRQPGCCSLRVRVARCSRPLLTLVRK